MKIYTKNVKKLYFWLIDHDTFYEADYYKKYGNYVDENWVLESICRLIELYGEEIWYSNRDKEGYAELSSNNVYKYRLPSDAKLQELVTMVRNFCESKLKSGD